jgi:hypothetical protein
MRSSPGGAGGEVLGLGDLARDRDPGLPDVDWGTQ